jgi:sugar phosphate isomerase/epimerase
VKAWLETPFDGGRHVARVNKLDQEIASAVVSPPPEFGLGWERLAVAISPRETVFGPVLFAGRFEQGLQAAARAGFCKVEISIRAPDDPLIAGLDGRLAQAGLKPSAIATGQSCLHDDLCLCSPHPERCAQAVQRLKAHIRLGKQLGAPVIIGGVRGKLTGTDAEKAIQRGQAVAAIRECAAFADELGVQLLLEAINRYEANFICSVDEGLAVLEEVGAPRLKLLLDTFHMNIEETDIGMAIRRAGDRLGYVHFADSNRNAPGSGHIDFAHLLAVLASIGYRGMISAEILPLPDDLTALDRTAAFFRTMIAVQKQ